MKNGEKKLRIGIDIDQTVANTFNELLSRFNQHFGVSLTMEDIKTFFYLEEVDVATYAERINFLRPLYNDTDLLLNQTIPIRGAPEYVSHLLADGHEIFFISTRDEKTKKVTREWLTKFGFPVNETNIHLGRTRKENGVSFKVRTIKEIGIDIFIEDDERVITSLQIPVIVMDYRWNRTAKGTNIYRANSWEEIYDYVNRLR